MLGRLRLHRAVQATKCVVKYEIIWGLTNSKLDPGPCGITSDMAAAAAALAAIVVAPTVGGGDGLPSESSTLASVRSSSCCSKNARSSLAR